MKRNPIILLALLAATLAAIGGFILARPSSVKQTITPDQQSDPLARPSANLQLNAEPAPLPKPVDPALKPSGEAAAPPSVPSLIQQAPMAQNAISLPASVIAGRPPKVGGSASTSPPASRPSRPSPISGATASAAARSSGPAFSGGSIQAASDGSRTPSGTVLEIDPGVPLPAAMMAAEVAEPAPVAAAREQVADSFVNDVESASDSTEAVSSSSSAGTAADGDVSDAYFQSLNQANEAYRALYGDEAFNRQSIRAMMEANNAE